MAGGIADDDASQTPFRARRRRHLIERGRARVNGRERPQRNHIVAWRSNKSAPSPSRRSDFDLRSADSAEQRDAPIAETAAEAFRFQFQLFAAIGRAEGERSKHTKETKMEAAECDALFASMHFEIDASTLSI